METHLVRGARLRRIERIRARKRSGSLRPLALALGHGDGTSNNFSMTYRILNIWGDGGHVTLSALSSDNRFLRAARPPKGGRRAHLCWSYILEGCGEIVL